ncbi:MAG: hypothetical protein V4736_06805 [Bdellovibrionota bacterium]
MLRFVDITSDKDLLHYQQETAKRLGVHFPLEYLKRSHVVGLRDNKGELQGGYALVIKGPFRVIDQIPQEVVQNDPELQKKLNKAMEITGLWLDASVRGGMSRSMLWLNLFFDVLLSGKSHFVYSYDAESKKLGQVYSVCSPSLIYKGPVRALEGMKGMAIECVEIGSIKSCISAFFLRPDFLLKKILVPRRLHMNKVFLKKAYSQASARSEKVS